MSGERADAAATADAQAVAGAAIAAGAAAEVGITLGAADAAASAVPMRLISGSPAPAELAAARAVVESLVTELREQHELHSNETPDAWQRSQRALRMPLTPGAGRWSTPF